MSIARLIKNKLKRNKIVLKLYFKYLRRIKAKPPKKISLEITEKCNLQCVMCNRKLCKHHKERQMSFKEFKQIMNLIPLVKHIDVMGYGEPFLNPDFFKMLKWGEDNGVTFSITTNAQLLNERLINKLTRNIICLWLSIDSVNPKNYEQIRVGGKYKTLMKNIRLINKLRPEIGLVIQTLLMKSNALELKQIVNLAKELNAELRFIHPLTSDPKINKEHMHNNLKLYTHVIEATDYARRNGVRISTRPKVPEMSIKYNVCFEPWKEPYITINGDILACCFMHRSMNANNDYKEIYRNQTINVPMKGYVMGNIFKDDFNKVWNGSAYKSLRKTVLESEFEGKLSFNELKRLRNKFNKKGRFNYCKSCLWRLCCAC